MYLNTHHLFEGVLKILKPDIILDVGSRDGQEALRFKNLCPSSTVVAYEANPHQFRKMAVNPLLARGIVLRNVAVASANGTTSFYVARADYEKAEDRNNNLGQSSLLPNGIDTQEKVAIETVTLDEELKRLAKQNDVTTALWIDVEGAEAEVFQGLASLRNTVKLIHVECATRPKRAGQKSMYHLQEMLQSTHVNIGHTSTFWRGWGDAVFIHRGFLAAHEKAVATVRNEARSIWLNYIVRRFFERIAGRV
jgi:FkbM family methyltransferase